MAAVDAATLRSNGGHRARMCGGRRRFRGGWRKRGVIGEK
jgi:hypothetical protein